MRHPGHSLDVVATFLSGAVLAVGRDKARYVRGTLSAVKKMAEGRFNTQTETELAFSAGKKGSVAIPYAAIASLEFEQKERTVVMIGFGPPVSKHRRSVKASSRLTSACEHRRDCECGG